MKTIEIDPFDLQSINRAIKELKAHETWRKQKITEYIHKLCVLGASVAKQRYGSTVDVHVTPDGKGIIAEGDQVVFLEFGTGTKTMNHELSAPLSIQIVPGSWSEGPEGKHTWSEWLRSQNWAGAMKGYPYDTTPRPGLYEAYKAIVANQEKIAQEVFGK